MCGIVGAVARRDIVPVLIEGLRRLEYRGYDSCGVAVYDAGGGAQLRRARTVSRVNAHPIFSRDEIAVVHNGIIENYEELRTRLKARGYVFESQTDTEVIAHLIHSHYSGDLFLAVQRAAAELQGAYAIAVFCKAEPQRVVGARQGSPLVLGVGANQTAGETFLASDAMALAGTTDQIIYLEEGDVADIGLGRYAIVDREGKPVERELRTVSAYAGAVELGPYRHFMQKEIFEQPQAIANTLEGVAGIGPDIFGDGAKNVFAAVDAVHIYACGTSYYSGLTAKFWLEAIAGLPTEVEVASEYRYRVSVPNPRALVVVISQSGETADTLAALKHAQSLGQVNTLAICNVASSAMVRQTALKYLTRAGVEIGVASTKAFTTQLAALFLLTLTLAKSRGRLAAEDEARSRACSRWSRRSSPGPNSSRSASMPCFSGAACTTRLRSKARSS